MRTLSYDRTAAVAYARKWALDRPLSTYIYDRARFLHIDGVSAW